MARKNKWIDFRESTEYSLSLTNFATMTTQDLRRYVQRAVKLVNQDIKDNKVNDQLMKAVKIIGRNTGVKKDGTLKVGIRQKTPTGYVYKTREELVQMGNQLKGFFSINVFTENYNEAMTEKLRKNKEAYEESTGTKLSDSDYLRLIDIVNDVQTVFADFGSDTVADLVNVYADDPEALDNLATVIKDVTKRMKKRKTGYTKEDLFDEIFAEMETKIGKSPEYFYDADDDEPEYFYD